MCLVTVLHGSLGVWHMKNDKGDCDAAFVCRNILELVVCDNILEALSCLLPPLRGGSLKEEMQMCHLTAFPPEK